jgi:NADPH:quinone reductase-like Zn-dependent oxidoreductase
VFGFWPHWVSGRRGWLRRRGPKLRLGRAQRALAEGGHGLLFANLAALWDSADALGHGVEQLLEGWRAGAIQPLVDTSYPLEAAADAHRDLETRRKIGMIVLQCEDPAPPPAE